jgi:hypothetical protein
MPGNEHLIMPLRIATVVIPVALYFLILGFLNTRRCPQLLTGRRDFALLVVAMSPLFVLPALETFGVSPLSLFLGVVGVIAFIWILGPRGRTWVIYNIPLNRANKIVFDALVSLGLEVCSREGGFDLPGEDATVDISGFSLLRNVSLHLKGGSDGLARQLDTELTRTLCVVRAEVSHMAVAMLLVGVAMLVAPLTLVARQAAEIVRILTDLLY